MLGAGVQISGLLLHIARNYAGIFLHRFCCVYRPMYAKTYNEHSDFSTSFFFCSQTFAGPLTSPPPKVGLGIFVRVLVFVCKFARCFQKMSSWSILEHKFISIWYYTSIRLNKFLCVYRPICCLGTCKHAYMKLYPTFPTCVNIYTFILLEIEYLQYTCVQI